MAEDTAEKKRVRQAKDSREYRKRNPEKIKALNAKRAVTHKLENGEKNLLRQYGITMKQYYVLFEGQSGLCGICNKEEVVMRAGVRARLAVDHNHFTGVIRGLLCHRCNAGLGLLYDDVQLLSSAIEYLYKNDKQEGEDNE